MSTHHPLPSNLPIPVDDGACAHLTPGTPLPAVSLPSTSGVQINPSALPGLSILFCYPRTGAPNEVIPDSWNAIPGARGCSPQACAFRDLKQELETLGVKAIFGVSTQTTEYQEEAKGRLHLPYDLLSDREMGLAEGLGLPTFEWEGEKLIKRVTLAVEGGKVVRVWYPVFPPDGNAEEVRGWLLERREGEGKR